MYKVEIFRSMYPSVCNDPKNTPQEESISNELGQKEYMKNYEK